MTVALNEMAVKSSMISEKLEDECIIEENEQLDINNTGESELNAGSEKLKEESETHWIKQHMKKKGMPMRAPKVGSGSDLTPGIVFKLYPTVISKTVSDYVLCTINFCENGNSQPSNSLPINSNNLNSRKRRHSVRREWEEPISNSQNIGTRRASMEQLVPRKENSDSEIDVTSVQSDEKKKKKAIGSRRPSHIVCNKLLMTTSRRISASGTVDGRLCASCNASITPYWRDGWSDELMLCNACGLRFQKFMKRCSSCSYIPRKEDNDLPNCPHCHDEWI